MNEDVVRRVEAIFAETLKVIVPSRDTDLLAENQIDSVVFVDLLLALEEGFGITILIDELDLEQFQSIDRIAAFVAGQIARDRPAAIAEV